MISIVPQAQKQLLKIDKHFQKIIIAKIQNLENPTANQIKKLSNRDGYRLRIGHYRIIFTKKNSDIIILAIAHRKDIYRQ